MDERERDFLVLLTDLVLEVFKLNGSLLLTGDRMVEDLDLTSARWQVLGAVMRAPAFLPVAHLARNLGQTRQAVQRVVDDLQHRDLVAFEPNPHHVRAKLVCVTERGRQAYEQAMARQRAWASEMSSHLSAEHMQNAVGFLRHFGESLENSLRENLADKETP